MIRKSWRPVLAAAWALAMGFLTLRPGGMTLEGLSEMPELCLLCGTRGTGDAILNLVLFVPLGLVLGGRPRSVAFAVAAGAIVSTGIEFGQMLLPGRHPSPADVLWNGLGAGAGALLYAGLELQAKRRSRMGARAWAVAVALAFAVLGALSTPAPTSEEYWGQWTPNLGHMPQYDGSVLAATLNDRSLSPGHLGEPRPHRDLLIGEWRMTGSVVVGPAPHSVAPIVSIYDGRREEILLLGVHRLALVFRERRIANALRFEAPDVRVEGAFAGHQRGDTVHIGARRADGDTCLSLNRDEWCGLGITPGRTWGYLLYLEGPPEWFRRVLDLVWLGMLFLPIGLFAADRRGAAAGGAAALTAMLAVIAFTPLIPGSTLVFTLQTLAAIAGTAVGQATLSLLRWVADTQPSAAVSITCSH